MNQPDPLQLAIRKISETRNLVQLLVTSSESFDYPKAKFAIGELQKKIKDLARAQAELEEHATAGPLVVQFSAVCDHSDNGARKQVTQPKEITGHSGVPTVARIDASPR